ncbi:MAG: transcriptional repressor NrdR [Deltaproteobacteria bacterium]|nr:transcriptional repressor NrdR [Deltaproteobacteria bacterium]
MKCPYCNNLEDKVIDSRISKDGETIRRRRECLDCQKRFTTHEKIEDTLPAIVKKDSRREPFNRDKILDGLKRACQKRNISIEQLEEITDVIEHGLMERGVKEIHSSEVGEKIMEALHDLDDVAYVRFASVYRSFKDITDFMEEVKTFLEKREEG